jgi:hypothetical protein
MKCPLDRNWESEGWEKDRAFLVPEDPPTIQPGEAILRYYGV